MGVEPRDIRRIVRLPIGDLRRRDLPLHAAAVTFYGGIAFVPVGLLTLRVAAFVAGADRLAAPTRAVVGAVPHALGADRAVAAFITAGLHLGAVGFVAALLPASLYGEGLRRTMVSLAGRGRGDAPERAIGWRGRLLVLPLLAVAPGLVLALLLVLPWAAHLLGRGGVITVAAVIVSFLIVWIVLSPALIWVYRVVGPGRPAWLPTVLVGSFTAANLSGFMHGFVLFWSLPLNLGLPFGGFVPIGAVVAVAFWLYLFHLVLLVGYLVTLQAHRWLLLRRRAPG